jgi:GNAT superfamily N-acetyltransferase
MALLPGTNVAIGRCPPEDYPAALEIFYRRVPASIRPGLVAEALDEAGQGRLDLSGLWIGRRRGRIAGVLLTQCLAGRAAAIWAPEVVITWGRAALATALVRAALASLRAGGVRIAQALIDTGSPHHGAADLTQGGLPRVTELTYLGRDTATPLEVARGVPAFAWRAFAPEVELEFREVLEATYIGSLDMPELEGARTLEDILATHRAGGRFDPSRWRMGRLPGEPDAAAVLILADAIERETWEVSYLGLTPQARRRGLGRAALAYALELAQPHTARLELAVDARNHPAERLYLRADFVPFDRRTVHLCVM